MAKSLEKRRREILNMVVEYGTVDFSQLRKAFPEVSDVTLRKDLQYLDDTQQAIRTHGGIKSIPSALNYFHRANVNRELKRVIAAKATTLIRPGDSIFVSAGTTCAELARCLPAFPLKVCSDGVYTVSNITSQPTISVELLGGSVDLNILRVEGSSTLNQLDDRHFNTAFLGALTVNMDYGFSHNSAMTIAILEKVIQHSDKVVVLLDSTKVSSNFMPQTIPFSAVDTLVTDSEFPADAAEILRSKGLEII